MNINMDQFELEKMRWAPKSQPLKGPMRLCRFCLLGIFFPIILLCIPLYMRFISLRPHIFTLSSTDMKLLNYEHTVSTMRCKEQTLRMNSSFNAYLLPEKPKLQRKRQRIKMERKIIELEDDMKEYWGFYLLKDSYFRLHTCSRHEGASVVIIKHSKNVERCAWLGELDSDEESDEISNEFDFQQEVLAVQEEEGHQEEKEQEKQYLPTDSTGEQAILSGNSSELFQYLNNIERWSEKSRKTMIKRLLQQIVGKQPELPDTLPVLETEGDTPDYRLAELTARQGEEGEEGEDASEDYNGPENVDHFFNNGKFNQKNKAHNKVDRSNEEVRSSYSSSEEALARCEGALYNLALSGSPRCNNNASLADMRPVMSNLSYEVHSTGFYYFIFTNENEITDNFVAANFDLHKTVFDVRERVAECRNTTECSLSFFSRQQVVLEVPQQESERVAECRNTTECSL